MTHEELLTKISDLCDNCLGIMAGAILSDALSAVVELHKPVADGCGDVNCCGPQTFICVGCPTYNYPCPTIQAIEKGLE